MKPPGYAEEVIVKPLSPITFTTEGRKKAYYYNPFEKGFKQLLRDNLRGKYETIFGITPD